MDIAAIIFLAGLLVFAAHFFAWLFSFTRIPDVLLLIVVGVIVGPLLGQITPDFFGEAGALFSLIVLAVMLFRGGTQIRLDVIRGAWRGTAALTTIYFLVSMAAVAVLIWFVAEIPFLLALTLGAIVGGTSSAVVIPLLGRLQVGEEAKAALSLESAMSDVLSVVLATAFLAAFEIGRLQTQALLAHISISFVGAVIIGLLSGLLWSLVLNRIRQMENSIFTTPAFVFILFGVAEALGLSGPIAALAFGITLGNSGFFKLWLERKHVVLHALFRPLSLSEREHSFFGEVVFVLQTFFFVYVGLSIPLFGSGSAWAIAALLVAAMFVLRIPVVKWTSEKDVPSRDRALMAAMVPKGLSTAVLATLLVQQQVQGAMLLQEVAYLMILISVTATAAMVFLVSGTPIGVLYRRLTQEDGNAASEDVPKAEPIIQ